MLLLKYTLTIVVTACVSLLFTFAWLVAKTKGTWGHSGTTAIDIKLVSTVTVHSPLYWLCVAAILACAWWVSRRWLF